MDNERPRPEFYQISGLHLNRIVSIEAHSVHARAVAAAKIPHHPSAATTEDLCVAAAQCLCFIAKRDIDITQLALDIEALWIGPEQAASSAFSLIRQLGLTGWERERRKRQRCG